LYDRFRNYAGRGCEMNTCGARHKMRTYRAKTGTAQ
jgi:predicted RNA-binding Zn ribbon-like protein